MSSFYSAFAEHYEAVFPFRPPTYAFLRRRLPPPPARVLDIGCGTGHYCGRLRAEGYRSLGIDSDAEMIAAARQRYPAARFEVQSMEAIAALEGEYAAAFCIGNVIAHLPSGTRERFLRALRARLRPGACWIVQSVNWDALPWRDGYRFPPRRVNGDGLRFERRYAPAGRETVLFQTRLARGEDELFSGETTLYPLEARAEQEIHGRCGFALSERCGDYRGRAYQAAVSPARISVWHALARS